MSEEQVQSANQSITKSRRHCLVDGCSCSDPRIVSRRRTAFFAVVAREHGETADRVFAVDASWSLAALSIAPAVELQ